METRQVVLIAAGAVLAAALLAVAAVLLVRLVRAYLLLRGADVPVSARTAFWGALVYTVFPVDLLPDPVYLDDIGLLLLALHHLGGVARRYGRAPGETEAAPPKAPKTPEARRRR
ncbi:DUF1232 domain-containing protein [Streptomyces radiopugnans]|uniref:DUF1232 domain-containing protein n=1 Tax=Streptomyces radiopugnans TaxID=403935 RepID=UPI003F1A7B3F